MKTPSVIPTPTASSPAPQALPFAVLPDDRWPGRLVVGGKVLDDFVALGEEAHADASWTVRIFQSASMPTLQIRAQWRVIGAATEWISTLVNNSTEPSGCVTEIRSLATSWPTCGPVDFYGNRGSLCEIEDFADLSEHDLDVVELRPKGGKSSNGALPFFALTDGHDSLAVGIGWSGQWCATIRHSAAVLQVEVGLPRVGFVLRPQESVRLPSVLLTRAPQASPDRARWALRSHLAEHVVPKSPAGESPNFTAHGMMCEYHRTRVTSEQIEIAALERAAKMGFEAYWVDACWYGNSTSWDHEVGSWNVRRSDFPRGLRPISDRAHELGMKFIFWIEPERARSDSEWARAYPELFLPFPDERTGARGLLLNLGDPRAVDLAFEKASSLITEFNADICRQDFNTWPLAAWRAADAPDRVGITEIKHIEGLYELWDRLLAAHPGLLIDNCAEGGRRIDLEALRRSIVLWRSDAGDLPGRGMSLMDISMQIHCWGLSRWIPDHGGPIKTFDAYAIRSALATGFMAYRVLPENEQDPEYADAIAAVAENKRLRSLIASSERIGLIRPYLRYESVTAFQHHHHTDSRGIIVVLRGTWPWGETVTLRPEHIDASATYQVTR